MSQVAKRLVSEEEYLKLEHESSEVRHEYVDGVVRLMAGTTQKHNDIVQNFVLKLTLLARKKMCRLAIENIRVKLPFDSKKRYYYPDVVVTCQGNDGDERTIENPCLIVEILSDSTSSIDSIDKGEKLDAYQRIASIKQYIIVEQTQQKVEVYTRHEDVWIYQMLESGNFKVACLDTSISLKEVYAGLNF